MTRAAVCGLPGPAEVAVELADADLRLGERARRRFDLGLRDSGMVCGGCADCATTGRLAVFGWTTPRRGAACVRCGRSGREAVVSREGRFY